jgi:lipoyl(octanoyl) transferase
MKSPKILNFSSQWLGMTQYQHTLAVQQEWVAFVTSSEMTVKILGCEHNAVVTLGIRSNNLQDVKSGQLPVIEVGRGGHATLHSPGQLVVYPIINLRALGISVRDWICVLQKSTKDLLLQNSVSAESPGHDPGLYTSSGKIAFFGIQVQRGVSLHGVSINLSNDLSLFSQIRSCGVEHEKFDSLKNHGVEKTPESLFIEFSALLENHLKSCQESKGTCTA